jgi:hypothetical protein
MSQRLRNCYGSWSPIFWSMFFAGPGIFQNGRRPCCATWKNGLISYSRVYPESQDQAVTVAVTALVMNYVQRGSYQS